MKVNVIKLEVEGESHEIRDALPAILTPTAPVNASISAPMPPVATIESGNPAPIVVDDAEILAPASREVHGAEHTPVMPDVVRGEWESIPAELRVWNAIGTCCHIAKNANDLYETWCGHDAGKVRPSDQEPRTQAEPCGNCLRRMQEAKRHD